MDLIKLNIDDRVYAMTNPENPQDDKVVEPDYIIVEGEEGTSQHQEHTEELNETQYIRQLNIPWPVRGILLLSSALCAIWLAVSVLAACVASLVDLVTLNKSPGCQRVMYFFLRMVPRAFAFTLGFFIGVFSPPLGIGFVMLYWGLYEKDQEAMTQMRSRFSRFQK